MVLLVRLLDCVLVAAVVAAPLAVAWAVTRTSVHETVGITPTTFSFTTEGQSELRLGIAGTVYLPVARGPLGVVARVDGPGDPEAGNGDLASYVTPQMLQLYSGLFHDPGLGHRRRTSTGSPTELVRELVRAELVLAALGGVGLFVVVSLRPRDPTVDRRRWRPRLVGAVAVAVVATSTVGCRGRPRHPTRYDGRGRRLRARRSLDGTAAAGSHHQQPGAARCCSAARCRKVAALVDAQEAGVRAYEAAVAEQGLRDQAGR